MTDDDDILTAPVPEPDVEASAAERAHAKAFAELVDKALVGGALPPAMSADDRALLEVATVIRACTDAPGLELAVSKQRSLVEDALRQAISGGGTGTSLPGVTSIASGGEAVASARAARRQRGWIPWVTSGATTLVAAAAITLLWLRPAAPPPSTTPVPDVATTTPASWRSRPADPLIGEIQRAKAGEASARLDTIFADRLDGYRMRRLSGGGRP